jgi:hypothetical protein
MWEVTHKFTRPPPCRDRTRTSRNGVLMLAFSGVTFRQKSVNISELLGGRMKGHALLTWHPCLKNAPSLGEKGMIC